jgi:RNA polymerase sigma factor (TIGR02999 family)
MSDVTRILSQMKEGDPVAAERLLPLVYDELRKLAAIKLAQEKPGQTLQATALVHEAYVRLIDDELAQRWNTRGHFFAAAAEAMRRILIDSARRKQRLKRGGDWQRVGLDLVDPPCDALQDQLLSLDQSLVRLEAHDPLAAQVVKLRYFAGLTMVQAAEALNIPLRTAERNWTYAKTWLHHDLQ